ncbi:protein phosphatase 1, regulatory subunit 3Db [Denticeps clupeoides]|uniref:CBM21 domain-containing protein n=1 Tax=Denticeps clupeoides TaxID=299321 RepID=A0AAY4EJV7_9TELE|nr:protein phosphatase 1 regulatory subunit 3D-like [Denticeps clupeoides]
MCRNPCRTWGCSSRGSFGKSEGDGLANKHMGTVLHDGNMTESGPLLQPLQTKTGQNVQFTSGVSSVSRPFVTVRLRDVWDPKPEVKKEPVRIRPPSPKPTAQWQPRRSLSCEPAPKTIMRRRAQSLPASRKSSHDPRHLQVRFVDSLGLDLEEVKVFRVGEDPSVPMHVISRLMMNSEMFWGKNLELSLPYFQPCFPEDASTHPGFLERLFRQRVCLERVLCSELGIIGTVQVLNLAYEKEVTVTYSFTDWKSLTDTKAVWVSTVRRETPGQLESDVFRFRLPVPPFILQPGAKLEFAICFQVMGAEYWDNNSGHNYKLICHNYKLTVPKECEDSMVHFI